MRAKILKRSDTEIVQILERYRKDYNIQSEIVNNLINTLTNTSEVKERKGKPQTIL